VQVPEMSTIWLWIGFLLFVFVLLALDLGVFHREAHVVRPREALIWTGIWVLLGLSFSGVVYLLYDGHILGIGLDVGQELTGSLAMVQYLTGYVVEKSLSVDNIFVIAMIFSHFNVPAKLQHRVLFWGIIGALVLRGAMILAGAALIRKFVWMNYVFGTILIWTAVKMLILRNEETEPEENFLVLMARRFFSVSKDYEGEKFFTMVDGRRALTPLFLVLVVVEGTDVLFALDSIPAIFGVTQDPFLVFTSNIFAILGLRCLYFALAHVLGLFRYLKMSLVFVLAFVGVKMIIAHHYPIPAWVSLAFILGILAVGVAASLMASRRDPVPLASPPIDPGRSGNEDEPVD